MSARFTPAARTFTRISPARRCGEGRSPQTQRLRRAPIARRPIRRS
jgi:hypothetical protein